MARGLYDTFPDYGKDFRRRLGIESEQALDLFHQTVSMKAVDNLNDFVRSHMLEPFDTKPRIDALVDHFENLTSAHDAVLRARAQLELLDPVVADLDRHDELGAAVEQLDRQIAALPLYFAGRTKELLDEELGRLASVIARVDGEIAAVHGELETRAATDEQLSVQIAGCGGDRLAEIEKSMTDCEREQRRRRQKFARFNDLLRDAGLEPVTAADQFDATRARVEARDDELRMHLAMLDNDVTEQRHLQRTLGDEAQAVNDELRSLQTRKSNLPSRTLTLREELCVELGVEPDALPFAGELLQVRDDAAAWEGAAERVLRAFALSLLVPDAHYDAVAHWIDGRHLGTRVVYFRVPARFAPAAGAERRRAQPILADMLDVKPDTAFGPWLEAELARRADHVCVDAVAEFRTVAKAVTRHGQVKDRDRHEKDDRRRLDDRREYVLGWTNEQKIDALVTYAADVQRRLGALRDTVAALDHQRDLLQTQRSKLVGLGEYTTWSELDWQAHANRITALRAEAERIRTSSDALRALTDERERVRDELRSLRDRLDASQRDKGAAANEHANAERGLAHVEEQLRDTEALERAREVFVAIDDVTSELGMRTVGLATVRDVQQAAARTLGQRRTDIAARRQAVEIRIVRAMTSFRSAYPQETAELDDSLGAADEYRELHHRIASDDLPRFEREFKNYLNQNTIREIAGFAAQLNKQEAIIRERIETINASLQGIDYNEGRYIRLVPDRTPNTEIREFRDELSACTDNVLGADASDQYSDQRFVQVKRIIDRFKGREGSAELDRNWTRRVTDVRQWFVFSASDRWRSDDTEYESYTDSAGKSGGQKEKLAYTILAASLAYQFKLEFGAARSRAFRFVVIDEAFGRGSEMSTRYALNLFTRLGLQLLIVTPLQKIHVIEPHVAAVGYVDNLDGNYSRLQGLTIEEYRRQRAPRPRLMSERWTTVDDLVATLRKRWSTGRYLRDRVQGIAWEPITLPVRAPSAAELLHDFDDALAWEQRFRRGSRTRSGTPRFAIETRTVKGHGLGVNQVPVRMRVDTFEQCCALLGTADDVRRLDEIVEQTTRRVPALLEWVARHPVTAIELHEQWSRLVDTVAWIGAHDTSRCYLRHIDVVGVDTKFVERNQKVLGRLLLHVLPADRIDLTELRFARRFGFRDKPGYTRLRLLAPTPPFPSEITEARVRTDELATLDLPVTTVFVVENEVSYLALPPMPNAIAVFGEGFHVTSLEALPWLGAKEIVYWGDIDTHGFVMLDRLRERFACVRSVLMDEATLLAHRGQLVTEPEPVAEPLPHLTREEQMLYRDLIEDRFGTNVRLEQERIRFSLVREALRPWSNAAKRTMRLLCVRSIRGRVGSSLEAGMDSARSHLTISFAGAHDG